MTEQEEFAKLWQESLMARSGCGAPFYLAVIIGIVFLLCSCATKSKIEYRDREVVKYNTQYVHDTTFVDRHDSIYHAIFQKGDTIYDTKYVEKTKWRDHIVVKTDTCYRDSIQTQIKETAIEKKIIPKWCYVCLVFCVLFIIFAIVKLIRWVQWH